MNYLVNKNQKHLYCTAEFASVLILTGNLNLVDNQDYIGMFDKYKVYLADDNQSEILFSNDDKPLIIQMNKLVDNLRLELIHEQKCVMCDETGYKDY